MENIRDIIFDLGGVIIGLDTSKTISAMAQLVERPEDEVLQIFRNDERFLYYEKGQMSDQEFRAFIGELADKSFGLEAIDAAWNAMILDIPSATIDLLRRLRTKYKVHLLSNTNGIHLDFVHKKLNQIGLNSFTEVFDNEFYSHKIGMRKPDQEIYEFVLNKGGMTANSTLFLDDNLDNLKGAALLGINTFQIKQLTDVINYFNGQKA